MIVRNVYVEEIDNEVFLSIEHNDETKHSIILRDQNTSYVDNSVIDAIKEILKTWGDKVSVLAETYVEDVMKDFAFLYDIIALAKFVSPLPISCKNLFEISEGSTVMHNRIVSQILYEYHNMAYVVDSKPTNFLNNQRHDFNVSSLRGEVKTIQSLGKLEQIVTGGYRFTNESKKSLLSKLSEDLEKAKMQAGDNGIIVLAPWSYKINAVLRNYFKTNLSLFPPPIINGSTVIVLSSDTAFEDYYISFPTNRVYSIMEKTVNEIDIFGIDQITITESRKGLPMRLTTAAKTGSFVSYSREIF